MQVGDVVRMAMTSEIWRSEHVGIIIQRTPSTCPNSILVWWDDGEFTEEWADELEVIDADR